MDPSLLESFKAPYPRSLPVPASPVPLFELSKRLSPLKTKDNLVTRTSDRSESDDRPAAPPARSQAPYRKHTHGPVPSRPFPQSDRTETHLFRKGAARYERGRDKFIKGPPWAVDGMAIQSVLPFSYAVGLLHDDDDMMCDASDPDPAPRGWKMPRYSLDPRVHEEAMADADDEGDGGEARDSVRRAALPPPPPPPARARARRRSELRRCWRRKGVETEESGERWDPVEQAFVSDSRRDSLLDEDGLPRRPESASPERAATAVDGRLRGGSSGGDAGDEEEWEEKEQEEEEEEEEEERLDEDADDDTDPERQSEREQSARDAMAAEYHASHKPAPAPVDPGGPLEGGPEASFDWHMQDFSRWWRHDHSDSESDPGIVIRLPPRRRPATK